MSDTGKLVQEARAHISSIVRQGGCPASILYRLTDALESERTRADKAEAEVARLREVIERAKEWADEITGGRPITNDFKRISRILAAVPVEPQTDHEGGQ